MQVSAVTERTSTGIEGLDDVLRGGFPAGHVYLVEGDPGTGKTTLGMQFLIDGLSRGEKVLYVTLAESREEIFQVATSHDFDLSGAEIFEVVAPELGGADQYTVFHPAEVELADVMQSILTKVAEIKPQRIVIDSMSEIRMLARESLRYRRQVLTLKQFFTRHEATVLLLDDRTSDRSDLQLQSIAHGALRMEVVAREFGVTRRRLIVLKVRGTTYREGYHDYLIEKGGMSVYPRLVSAEHQPKNVDRSPLFSGIPELDKLMGGGLNQGTSTLVMGPAGVGKSTLTMKFMNAAADRGQRGILFAFDETVDSIMMRTNNLGMNIEECVKKGLLRVEQIDPAELAPGQFVQRIRDEVADGKCKVVIIDSVNGLLNAMPGEQALAIQLHELISYLNQIGVSTFLVMAQYGILGSGMVSPVDVSYLADNILLMRYFEALGEVRQAISVVKKRIGRHERTIREFRILDSGFQFGDPLSEFEGVLSGIPRYTGEKKPLL